MTKRRIPRLSESLTREEQLELAKYGVENAMKTGLGYLEASSPYIELFLARLQEDDRFQETIAAGLKSDPLTSDPLSPEGKFVKHLKASLSGADVRKIAPMIDNIRKVRGSPPEQQELFYQRVAEACNQKPVVVRIYFNLADLATRGLAINPSKIISARKLSAGTGNNGMEL